MVTVIGANFRRNFQFPAGGENVLTKLTINDLLADTMYEVGVSQRNQLGETSPDSKYQRFKTLSLNVGISHEVTNETLLIEWPRKENMCFLVERKSSFEWEKSGKICPHLDDRDSLKDDMNKRIFLTEGQQQDEPTPIDPLFGGWNRFESSLSRVMTVDRQARRLNTTLYINPNYLYRFKSCLSENDKMCSEPQFIGSARAVSKVSSVYLATICGIFLAVSTLCAVLIWAMCSRFNWKKEKKMPVYTNATQVPLRMQSEGFENASSCAYEMTPMTQPISLSGVASSAYFSPRQSYMLGSPGLSIDFSNSGLTTLQRAADTNSCRTLQSSGSIYNCQIHNFTHNMIPYGSNSVCSSSDHNTDLGEYGSQLGVPIKMGDLEFTNSPTTDGYRTTSPYLLLLGPNTGNPISLHPPEVIPTQIISLDSLKVEECHASERSPMVDLQPRLLKVGPGTLSHLESLPIVLTQPSQTSHN
ncbi:hypothetical protein Ciccas_006178 [Cichlidogyrus casuarinus]|uniref:Fibronectin type-III domain-containing protein n=1 Tax=Cichlidogyrus casuarinus TaxID=1844966 RepID=A0ABD2Q8Y9_9PLAT